MFHRIVNAIETGSPELLVFDGVDVKHFTAVRKRLRRHASEMEGHSFRIHFFSGEKVLKIVIPSMMHECVGGWINATLTRASRHGIIPDAWDDTMLVMSAPEYDNFAGEFCGSVKEADITFVPRVGPYFNQLAEYPTVVLESGCAESSERLTEDARMWQIGSNMGVRVVLQAKFFPADHNYGVRFVFLVSRANPKGGSCLPDYYEIFPPPANPYHNPSISFEEFYGGNCPPGIDPKTKVELDLARLAEVAAIMIRQLGHIPA
ncbi:hypothetical protein B9Z19DRAFT_1066342 [Tuber borchii]|uniref:Uncharacterized protein n=1 Tax=Tuber borchii TaxID=42251 RepID=A0A2T6ZMX9_TUBBO|nr:hypothetical protein B9Z19DRAFT_1066342 [Tuber borchii]